jgi:hypothetical protein
MDQHAWRSVCISPCSTDVTPRERYRVQAKGFVPTQVFPLRHSSEVFATLARASQLTAAVTATITGSVFATSLWLAVAGLAAGVQCSDRGFDGIVTGSSPCAGASAFVLPLVFGIIDAAVGLIMFISGGVFFAGSSSSVTLTISPAARHSPFLNGGLRF